MSSYERFGLSKLERIGSDALPSQNGTHYTPIGTLRQVEAEGVEVNIAHCVAGRIGLWSATMLALNCRVMIYVCWSCEPDILKPFTVCSCSTKKGKVMSWRFGRLGLLETHPSVWK